MSVVSKLASFSTCEISDALIKLGVTSGGYIAGLKLFSAGKICASAYTVKMVLTSDKSAPKLSEHFVDTAPAGSVIIVDAPRGTESIVIKSVHPIIISLQRLKMRSGVDCGLMSAGAIARSAVGVVISGHCRDLAEHRALGFPVFARSHSTLGQQPFTRPSAINIPLVIAPPGIAGDYTFPSVTVEPGDWIIGDEDGVVCVSKAMEGEVAEEAESKRAVDAQCMIDIQAGKGIQATFAKYRK